MASLPPGGVGVGAWGPPDDGEGMRVDSVTDLAGAVDSAWSSVGVLGLGQVGVRAAGAGVGLSAVHGVLARQDAHLAESWDGEMGDDVASGPDAAPAGLSVARAGGVSRKAAANRLKRQRKAAEQRASQPPL